MQLDRLHNESDIAYHKRLIFGKLDDKSLADVDFAELARAVYGKDYSSDTARRMMYGSYRTLQILGSDIGPKDGVGFVGSQILRLQKEQQQVRDQRRELNNDVRVEARREHLESALIAAANDLHNTVGRAFDNRASDGPYSDICVYDPSESEAVLVLSDWHYGMKTDNVFNYYDTSVCKDRVGDIVQGTVDRIVRHGCKKLHVVILGDLIHGGIHCTARVASEELVCDQLMQVSEILAQAIEVLSRYVEELFVYTTYGNHARTIQNKKDSVHRDNMERLIPWWIDLRLASCENVSIVPDDGTEFLFLNVCGHEICASHGDLDSVRTSPRLLPTLFQKVYGKDVEYILIGDKHHRESFSEVGVTAMICGSLCGTDDYANEKRLYSNPEQLLLIVNEKDGVDAEYRLKC